MPAGESDRVLPAPGEGAPETGFEHPAPTPLGVGTLEVDLTQHSLRLVDRRSLGLPDAVAIAVTKREDSAR